jgi:HD-GYP domain-containing protein (c-di-GMP phosphodiesterase class II)
MNSFSPSRAGPMMLWMSLEPTLEEQQRLETTRLEVLDGMAPPERRLVILNVVAFLIAAAGLWIVDPPHHVHLAPLLWTMAVMVLATRVRFETPFGFTVATQLAFVPLMFAVPTALVPLASCVAIALSGVPDVLAREIHPSRLLHAPRNTWFAFGPAWVFALTGVHHDAGVIVLLAALAAQFACDFVFSSAMVIASRHATLAEQLSDSWVYLIDAALSGVGFVVAEQMRDSTYALLAVVPLLGLLWMFARERSGHLESLIELNETYHGTALLLGDVVAADDTYTGSHSLGVVELAMSVGTVLGLGPEQRRNLEFAARLHDVGKIAIPKEILNKPGKLDEREWALMRTHSEEGERMLARVGGFMTEVGAIVRSHHERWDGGGYPDGLLADAAPLEARIITCCDSWSAMRTDRPYRRAMSHQAALAEVQAHVGTQFDPRVADALMAVVAQEPDDVRDAPAIAAVAGHSVPALSTVAAGA